MIRLSEEQVDKKIEFIENYLKANNAADASVVDANANVSSKNIATMSAELNKDVFIQVNRGLISKELTHLFGEEIANLYIEQLENHSIYTHDESSLAPYCVAASMYPFLTEGLRSFGGESDPPKHLSSFNGGFINYAFALASQFAGAVATVEYLVYFDYFARKDFGDDYLETHSREITQELQQTVYALNQPAAARNYQSVFWNISILDRYYFEAIFEHFRFPDGSEPKWETLKKLQKHFMRWFNKERTKSILTFPVVTASFLNDGTTFRDHEFGDMISQELAEGNSFFIFTSTNAQALSSCCRLRSDVSDSINDFSYSLGAGGVMTGSLNVITLNMNRFIQTYAREVKNGSIPLNSFKECLQKQINLMHMYQVAFRKIYERYLKKGILPAYNIHAINMDKQYLTLGINGLVEGAEFIGLEISNNNKYKEFIRSTLKVFSEENKKAKQLYGYKFNTEFVPAENLGVKFAKWDRQDGYKVPRDCYNSYFYLVENNELSPIDKLTLHGKDTSEFLDGGSACHINLENYPTKEAFKKLIHVAIQEGCPYFCFNVKVTICNQCNTIDKRTLFSCTKCGSTDVDHATRIIGYLKRIKDFSSARQEEENLRYYHKE